ncbi:MAG: hypothetical protein Kow009_16150 [Spirochaetales bacterium]
MWKLKNVFYLSCLWETIRILFLFTLVSLLLNPGARILYTLYTLWLCAPLLVLPLLSFLLGLQPERIPSLRPVLLFGKVVGLIPLGILLAFLYLLPAGSLDKTLRWGMIVPLTIGFIDFLFILFLVFYPHTQES